MWASLPRVGRHGDQPWAERCNRFAVKTTEGALGLADGVAIAQVARLELLAPEERLDPERLIRGLQGQGKQAFYLPTADAIVDQLGQSVQPDEVVCVFSNGGFGGIHDKLLARFNRAS